ncbi:phage portal protein [Phaeobacter porticola]|uniref:Phage portal protein, lambda family n=1 Tax=Phaeobacter porticola TaxID=1844006 RepID=A0A1L3I0P3_9RHOB|nr:phage portal protein [Phaeobacter porticola]APG45688.1 phage portal protein, lambda family [Phaeobacter porticola]
MRWLDKAVLAISPERGLARVKARSAAHTLMNYDAASKGRRTYGWKSPGTSADSAALGSRSRLRNLSRDFMRNRALAVRGRDVTSGNVVGTGIRPSVRMEQGQEDRASEAMEVVQDHLLTSAIDTYGVSDILGLQTLVMNTVFTDGEILVRRRMRNTLFDPNLKLPFQVQLMEVDHLDESITSNGNNDVIEGIEYGPTGKAVAYHLFDQHPGEVGWRRRRKMTSTRVPAEQILHIRRIERPGQMRGIPWLAPVMTTLGEISDYQDSQILKQKIGSLLAFFVKSGADGKTYAGAQLSHLEPGAIVGLAEGQEVTPSEPPKVDGYQEFMNQAIRTIAVGLGLSYESFGDLRGVNFSSGKMGRIEMDRFVEIWQRAIIITQFCMGVSRWTRDGWRLVEASKGLAPVPKSIDWTAPKRPMIDPAKEIGAAVDEIEAGLTSLQRKQRELGYDPDVIAREREEDANRGGTPAAPANRNQRPPEDETIEEDEEDERQ